MLLSLGMTDDQLALAGCFAALVVSGTLMSLSYYLGRALRGDRRVEPARATVRLSDPARVADRSSTDRKAA